MNQTEDKAPEKQELPDSWWYPIYVTVVATTILVIALLWAFTKYFS